MTLSLVPFNINLLICRRSTLKEWQFELSDPFWRIYWMASVGWSIRYHEKSLPLTPEHLVVIPPGTQCRSESHQAATQFYAHFTLGTIVNPYKPGVYFLPISAANSDLLKSLMNPPPESLVNNLTNTLQVKQLCYNALSQMPSDSIDIKTHSPKIVTAMESMVRSLRTPLSNKELAEQASMNTNAFIRLFHQETGQSPQKWYLEKRINQAALFLSHSSKTIESIAEETAFFDRNHFSRVFKQIKGTGPAAYRKASANRR